MAEDTQQAGVKPEGAIDSSTATVASEAFDPKTLDAKLIPVYKGMEAAHTQRSQALAEDRKRYDAERQEFETTRQAWLAEQAAAAQSQAHTQAEIAAGQGMAEGTQELLGIVKQQVAEQTRPFLQRQVEAEITELSNDQKHGALFKSLMPQIAQVIRATGLSMKQAFAVAAGPDRFFDSGRQAAFAETQKKIDTANGVKPGPASSTVTHAGKMNIRESFEATAREAGIA